MAGGAAPPGFSLLSHFVGVLELARLVSREGIEAELVLDTRDLTLSFRDVVIFISVEISSSRTDPSVSHNIGVEDDELPDTVLAIESFFL